MSREAVEDSVAAAPSFMVVLRCQVHAGAEPNFDRWVSKLASSAIRAPGFVGAMIESETVDHHDRDWALTYRFSAREHRDAWMSTGGYRSLLEGSRDLFVIPPVPERVDRGERPTATEAVVSVVPPHRTAAYVAARDEIDRTIAGFPGFVKVDHYPPSGLRDRTWTTVIAFDSAEDLARWRDSSERAQGIKQIRKIAPDVAKVLPWGFGRWFAVDPETGQSAPAWKQAMVVMAVLYAMVSLLDMTLGDYLGPGISVKGDTWVSGLGAQLPVIVFLSNLVGTVLLTWVLMPVITGMMQWWLRPDASTSRTIQGIVLMIVIYAVEIAIFVWIYDSYQI